MMKKSTTFADRRFMYFSPFKFLKKRVDAVFLLAIFESLLKNDQLGVFSKVIDSTFTVALLGRTIFHTKCAIFLGASLIRDNR